MSKYKAHQRYRLADNTICPGVTTVTGILGMDKGVFEKAKIVDKILYKE